MKFRIFVLLSILVNSLAPHQGKSETGITNLGVPSQRSEVVCNRGVTCGVQATHISIQCGNLIGRGSYTAQRLWSFESSSVKGSMSASGLSCFMKNPREIQRVSLTQNVCPKSIPILTSTVSSKLSICVNAAKEVCRKLGTTVTKVVGAYSNSAAPSSAESYYYTNKQCK